MDVFMPTSLLSEPMKSDHEPRVVAEAAWHSLLWLLVANVVGVCIAVLLLLPGLNVIFGEWTYGRWITVHMNLELYGWTSLPLVGFVFHVYRANHGASARWCRPVLWIWSAALGVGALSWLSGYSSGKLFLDWTGYARILFAIALLVLWFLLLAAFIGNRDRSGSAGMANAAKVVGLIVLFAVPFAIYIASSPNLYPAVNPGTGGPTGASQLESSLMIVLVLLMIPFGVTQRKPTSTRLIYLAWALLAVEAILCVALGNADTSNHSPAQFLSLGSLIVWIPLVPAYYAAFRWNGNTRRWRLAFLWWWGALVLTGWIFFLPGVLDHFKFTDGLVGHSFVAMAGFTSSLVIFLLIQLMGDDGWIFNQSRSFYGWHAGVIVYILAVTLAGWREGYDPAFTIVPGAVHNALYTVRLFSGIFMLLASLDWFVDATAVLRQPAPASTNLVQEQTA